ncbi:hypothetical protein GH714_019875 [Hevea brasiliensis]|uniref:Uncharacterized protein n=1 Tax=Hevea brasiliensis TaxID=3981 RepID=A0A6A6K7Y4_HEVBR|nr:hypothetical protein GH714_019875 [Hevea brasiliensis]
MEWKWSDDDLIERFNQLSRQERAKFNIELLRNFNNVDLHYTVVTILMAIKSVPKVPAIRSTNDVKEILQCLKTIDNCKILALEVLWTPQDENDTLSEQELLTNYPSLRSITTS